ncbi:MAG: NrdH-redoxin [Anaerolineales bacterium]|nr:NrdH-redoxin [Anaerolineales bacterium]
MPEGENQQIFLYGTQSCPDCWKSRRTLKRHDIEFEFVDVDKDAEGSEFVKSVNNGMRSVPTIVFPDGDILVEPSNSELEEKLGQISA